MRWLMKLALVSLLLAWGLFGLGVAVLSPGPSSPVALSSYESLWRAQDGLPGTLPTLEGLASRSDGLGWQARISAGRAHVATGDQRAGADFLKSALSLRATTDLRRELASALEAAGEPAEALAQWKRLLPRSEAIAAVKRLEPDPLRLAGLLAGAGRYTEAWSLVRSNSKPEARLTRARILVGLGLAKEALTEFEQALGSAPTDVAVRKEYARALERAGEAERSLAAYRALGATGAYEAGRLLEALGRPKEAVAAYLLSKDGEARWRGARLLETDGQTDSALAIYLELARGTHRVHDDAALRAYLLAERRGRTAEAREMASLFPPAFQWLLGTYRAPAPLPSRAGLQNGSPMAIPVAEALLDSLPAADGAAWAEAELDLALPATSTTEKVAIANWFVARGDYHAAFGIGTPLLRNEPARETYVLSYPLAFWDSVNRWAATYGVDPLLVLAVIREESNYLPTAVSSSNARGLMQLLPSTAKWIAEAKVSEPFSEGRLSDPDFNIRLGTWYLGYLIRLFDSDVSKAVAAYNGGQGNVERWSTAAKVKTAAEFPGALVASETREYLVKVLNSWLLYRSLYSD